MYEYRADTTARERLTTASAFVLCTLASTFWQLMSGGHTRAASGDYVEYLPSATAAAARTTARVRHGDADHALGTDLYTMYLDDNLFQSQVAGARHTEVLLHPATNRGQVESIYSTFLPLSLGVEKSKATTIACAGDGNCASHSILNGLWEQDGKVLVPMVECRSFPPAPPTGWAPFA